MAQSDVEPTLSSDELDILLIHAAIVDEDGYEPEDDDWTATYSPVLLNKSIAAAWELKAGKLGAGESFTSDGATFNPQERRQFALDMADRYRRKVAASVETPGRTAYRSSSYSSTVIN
jgi:hypothetical protein